MTTLAQHGSWALRAMLDPRASFSVGRASVLLGAAGVGWFFVEAHHRRLVPTLDDARCWLSKAKEALADTHEPWRALHTEAAQAPLLSEVSRGLVSGGAGVHALALALAALDSDRDAARAALRDFDAGWRWVRTKKLATLYCGAGGYALVARALAAMFPRGSSVNTALTKIHQKAAERTIATLSLPLSTRMGGRERVTLAVAHGVGGEIWSAMSLHGAGRVVRRRLDEYLALATCFRDYIAWPDDSGGVPDASTWGSFCNGVSGQGLLYARAYERFGDERYLDIARRCALTVHALRPANPSFCCGAAGQAALLARVADLTGDARLRAKARARLGWAVRTARADGSRSVGLYQGLAAITLLLDAPEAKRLPWPLHL